MRFSGLLRPLYYALAKPIGPLSEVFHLQIEPTTYCNLACRSCPRDKVVKAPGHMALGDFEYLLYCAKPRKITLSGLGESLLNPDLCEMISLAQTMGITVNTCTNLNYLRRDMAERLVSSGLDLLKVSIDSASPATYRLVRGKAHLEQVLQNLTAINEAKLRANSQKPHVRLQFLIQRENYREIADFVALAKKLGAASIYFQALELSYVKERKENLAAGLTKEDLYRELLHGLEEAKKGGVQTNLPEIISDFEACWAKYDYKGGDPISGKKCLMPWLSAYVTVNGDLWPCCSFATVDYKCGNVFENDFFEIWNGQAMADFRRSLKNGEKPFDVCRNCLPKSPIDFFQFRKLLPGFFWG